MSTQPLYVPYPDPRYPETMTQANIDILNHWGVIAVSAWADLAAYRADAGSFDTWPVEGSTGKTWCNTAAFAWGAAKRYIHYRLLRDDRGRPVRRALDYSDVMFSYMPPNLAQCFRSRPHLFAEVPLWRRTEYSHEEAARLNFSASPVDDIPIGRFHDQTDGEVGEGNAFPTDVAFRFRPSTDIIEFFKIERFIAANPIPTNVTTNTPKRLPDTALVAAARNILASNDPIAAQAAALRRLATA